jgi:serine protease Do
MKNNLFLALLVIGSYTATAQEGKIEEVPIEKVVKDKTHNQKVIKIVINGDKEKYQKMQIEIDGNAVKINGKASTKLDSVDVYIFNNNIVEHRINKRGMRNGDETHRLLDEYSIGIGQDIRNKIFNMTSGAYLGITMEKKDNGIAIVDVAKESAAEKAGLLPNDIITKIDGFDMTVLFDITNYISKQKKGTIITIDYLRDGKTKTTKATLEGRKNEDAIMQDIIGRSNEGIGKIMPMDSMHFPDIKNFDFKFDEMPNVRIYRNGDWKNFGLTPKLGLSLKETESGNGLEVITVEENSVAAKAGMQKGDIVTSVANTTTNDIKDVKKAVQENKDKAFDINYLRNGKAGKAEIKFPKKLKEVDM